MLVKLAEDLTHTDTIVLSGEYLKIESIIMGAQNITVAFSSRPAVTFRHSELVAVSSPNWNFKISEALAHEILRKDCPSEMPYNLLNEEGEKEIRTFVIQHAKDKSEHSVNHWLTVACDLVNHVYVYPCDLVSLILPGSATTHGEDISMTILPEHHCWYVNYSWDEWVCALRAFAGQHGIIIDDLTRWYKYFNERTLPEDAVFTELEIEYS